MHQQCKTRFLQVWDTVDFKYIMNLPTTKVEKVMSVKLWHIAKKSFTSWCISHSEMQIDLKCTH